MHAVVFDPGEANEPSHFGSARVDFRNLNGVVLPD